MMRLININTILGNAEITGLNRTAGITAVLSRDDICFANKIILLLMLEANHTCERFTWHLNTPNDVISHKPATVSIRTACDDLTSLSPISVLYSLNSFAIFERYSDVEALELGFSLKHVFLFQDGEGQYLLDGNALQALSSRCQLLIADKLSQVDIINNSFMGLGRPIQVAPGEDVTARGVDFFHLGILVHPLVILLHDLTHVVMACDMDDACLPDLPNAYSSVVKEIYKSGFYPEHIQVPSRLLWLILDTCIDSPLTARGDAHPLSRVLFANNTGWIGSKKIDYSLYEHIFSDGHFTAEAWLTLFAIRAVSGHALSRKDLVTSDESFDSRIDALVDDPKDLLDTFPASTSPGQLLPIIASLMLTQELNHRSQSKDLHYSVHQVYDVVKDLSLNVTHRRRSYFISTPGHDNVIELIETRIFDPLVHIDKIEKPAKKYGLKKPGKESVNRSMLLFEALTHTDIIKKSAQKYGLKKLDTTSINRTIQFFKRAASQPGDNTEHLHNISAPSSTILSTKK